MNICLKSHKFICRNVDEPWLVCNGRGTLPYDFKRTLEGMLECNIRGPLEWNVRRMLYYNVNVKGALFTS